MVKNQDTLADIMIIIIITVVSINFFCSYGSDAKIVGKHLTFESELHTKMPPWSYSHLPNPDVTTHTCVVKYWTSIVLRALLSVWYLLLMFFLPDVPFINMSFWKFLILLYSSCLAQHPLYSKHELISSLNGDKNNY